jgi:hypothetical protein
VSAPKCPDLKGVVLVGHRYRNQKTSRVAWLVAIHKTAEGQPYEVSFRYEARHERTSCWPIAEFVEAFRLIRPRVSAQRKGTPEGGNAVPRPLLAVGADDKGA